MRSSRSNRSPLAPCLARLGKVGALPALLLLCGCKPAVLDPQGPVGGAERVILFNALAIMLAIVVPTIVATLGFAWWFRTNNSRATRRPHFAYSGRLEAVVWAIPTMVIIFLGGIAWIGSHELDPARPLPSRVKPLEIQAVSLDWKWLFLYPEQGVAALNTMTVPAGTPLHLQITSGSVMTAFFVPQLGSMIYAMNGMTTQLNLQADATGTFHGLASHFSGDGFSDMNFPVNATEGPAFDKWVRDAKASGEVLDRARYDGLARQSMHDAPAVFRLPDATLFNAIATQQIPPAPGPHAGQGGPDVSPRPGG